MLLDKEITLEIKEDFYNKLEFKQYDTGNRLIVNITNNHQPLDLTGHSVNLYVQRSDGNISFLAAVSTSNLAAGKLIFLLTSNTLSFVGNIKFELSIIKDTEVITTKVFVGEVLKTIRDDSAVQSTNEFTALSTLTAEVQDIKNNLQVASTDLETKYTTRLNNVEDGLDNSSNTNLVNLIENSDFKQGLLNWGTATNQDIILGGLTSGTKAIKISPTTTSKYMYCRYTKLNLNFNANTWYTLSYRTQFSSDLTVENFTNNGLSNASGNVLFRDLPSDSVIYNYQKLTDANEWRISISFKFTQAYNDYGLLLGAVGTTDSVVGTTFFKVAQAMLCEGKHVRPYIANFNDYIPVISNRDDITFNGVTTFNKNVNVAQGNVVTSTGYFQTKNTKLLESISGNAHLQGFTGDFYVNDKKVVLAPDIEKFESNTFCQVTLSANSSLPTQWGTVPLNKVIIDIKGEFNATKNAIVIKETGYYSVSGMITFEKLTDNGMVVLGIESTVANNNIAFFRGLAGIGTQQCTFSGSTILKLIAGEEIQLNRYTNMACNALAGVKNTSLTVKRIY